MNKTSAEQNKCPVCGKPRGKGRYEFAHGKCAEEFAKAADAAEEVELMGFEGKFAKVTKAQYRRARDRAVRKGYVDGKLPPWMLE